MKTFIGSDFHGENPTGLVRSLVKNEGIERAVFLGDYDEPTIFKDIRNLDIDKIVLLGNHDYDLCKGNEIYSQNLKRSLTEYWELWGDTPEGKYARKCAGMTNGLKRGIKVIRRIGEEKAVYVHGSLVSVQCEESPREVWGRILHGNWDFTQEQRVICNFREMKKNNYWAMFRGHDHFPITFSTNIKDYSEEINQVRSSIDGGILNKGDMHIVSVGAFVEGEYCLFDDKTRKLEYRNAKD